MKFEKYPSIENSYREEFIGKIKLEQKDQGTWLVTEKIHGANFSFWYDGKKFRMAKRSGWMADDEHFFGCQSFKADVSAKIRVLYHSLNVYKKIDYIAVFGEIFGGTYPHPEVPIAKDAKKVQKGVYYCPDNRFMVYDIKLDGEFMDWDKMTDACYSVGLYTFMALETGTFEKCLVYKNNSKSFVGIDFGYPEIKDNVCEGIVIRPNKTQYLSSGSRVILKSKNEKWSEKASKKKCKPAGLSKEGGKYFKKMLSYVTENRYDAIVSKIGEVKISDFGKIHCEFGKDVNEEFMKNTRIAIEFINLDKAEQKWIKSMVNREIASIIRRKLVMV